MSEQQPTCSDCGSTEIRRDAWAYWDAAAQRWAFGDVFDNIDCADCGSRSIVWGPIPPEADA